MARAGASQRPGAAGADLPADRCGLRRGDHLAAEGIGGERNWDYRYAWVRDASFTLEALWVAACPDEAHQYFDYLAASAAASVGDGRDLQIMFGIGGEHDLTERELTPCGDGATPGRSGWATARGTSASSTCTASCSARRTGWPSS